MKIARQPCNFSPVMQPFGPSDEKGSLLNRTANRAKMLTEPDACVTATRCDVFVESSLIPEGRAELHACRLVALRVADAYRKLGYRAGLANPNKQNAIVVAQHKIVCRPSVRSWMPSSSKPQDSMDVRTLLVGYFDCFESLGAHSIRS